MLPAQALLASLALLLPAWAEAHPCEEEVKALAAEVTRLENLVAADRAAGNDATSVSPVDLNGFEALERKLAADDAELRLGWQALLAAQERCNAVLGSKPRTTDATEPPRFAIDVKAAYAIPTGKVWDASAWNVAEPMTAAWTGAIPLEVAARYRFTPELSAGVVVGWAPAFVANPGIQGFQATAGSDLRVGLEVAWEPFPVGHLSPWVLLGTGWEWARYSGAGASVTMSGWQYLDVEAGLGFRATRAFSVGPFIGFSGGTFTNIAATGSWAGWGGAIPSEARSFHGWLRFGFQGTAGF